ncbi:MAG: hypothetical protein AB1420_07985 [Bacillota bacterium]
MGDWLDWNLEVIPNNLNGPVTAIILEIEYADGTIKEEDFTDEVLEMMGGRQ